MAPNANPLPAEEQLLTIYRLKLTEDTTSHYAVVTRELPAAFKIRFFDSEFRASTWSGGIEDNRDHVFLFDSDATYFPERFFWVSWTSSSGVTGLIPAWLSSGTKPLSEQPAYDPWNPHPVEEATSRLYFLTPEGIHSLDAPKGKILVEALEVSGAERERGQLNVLLAEGSDYNLKYFVARVQNGHFEDARELQFRDARMLAGSRLVMPLQRLDAGLPESLTVFCGDSLRATLRCSVVGPTDSTPSSQAAQPILRAPSPLDSLVQVPAVFLGNSWAGAFALTQYRVQFFDFGSGTSSTVDRRKFGFVPGLISNKLFFPVFAEGPHKEIRPALLSPESVDSHTPFSVAVPIDQDDRRKLIEPARFQFQSEGQCRALANPYRPAPDRRSEAVFFCGEFILRIPLTLP